MAFHSLSKPHTVSTREHGDAQGHPHYWRDGRRREAIEKHMGYNPEMYIYCDWNKQHINMLAITYFICYYHFIDEYILMIEFESIRWKWIISNHQLADIPLNELFISFWGVLHDSGWIAPVLRCGVHMFKKHMAPETGGEAP